MRYLLLIGLLSGWAAAWAQPFPQGDAEIGKRLFDKNQCDRCHRQMVGGDGNAIFTRPDHKVRNAQQMVEQMRMCSANVGITLSPSDEQHLGAYLDRFYKLK